MLIYKYCNIGILKILENNSIKFAQRNELNDPFELFPYWAETDIEAPDLRSIIGDEEYDASFKQYLLENPHNGLSIEQRIEIEKEFRNQKNPFVDSNDNIDLIGFYKQIRPQILECINKNFVILSLTKDPLNIPMWAHYAENHKGFVIGFEANNDFFIERYNENLMYRTLKKVVYSTERMTINDRFDMDTLLESFFIKSDSWKYESEWRVVRFLPNYLDSPEYFLKDGMNLFKFPKEIVKEIYFGLNSSSHDKDKIFSIINNDSQYHNIQIFQTELDKVHYKLNALPI